MTSEGNSLFFNETFSCKRTNDTAARKKKRKGRVVLCVLFVSFQSSSCVHDEHAFPSGTCLVSAKYESMS